MTWGNHFFRLEGKKFSKLNIYINLLEGAIKSLDSSDS